MQGFNMGRYVPPDLEGTKTSGNALHRRRAPGQTNAKGTQTVRFEMPFAVWCGHCPKPTLIGQGVRFNADKARDGNYHSTPIWRFTIKHNVCGGTLVIRTDPKNTAYEVVEGGTARDYGADTSLAAQSEGGQKILTDDEREALRKNAFAKLERTIDDRVQLRQASQRIDELSEVSTRDWADPYAQNQKLRKAFRAGRKERERDAVITEELQGRMGLGFELLPATEEDGRRAALVDFEADGEGDVLSKPLFKAEKSKAGGKDGKGVTKAERERARRKDGFVTQVMGNTRVAKDPFLNGVRTSAEGKSTRLPGVKRKRDTEKTDNEGEANGDAEPPSKIPAPAQGTTALVSYDSD